MDLSEFIAKQGEVYSKFRDISKLEAEGTKPSLPAVPQGGYLIPLRHSPEIAEKIEAFSRRVAKAVPLMVYDASTIHTTLSDFGIRDNFTPEEGVLNKLNVSLRNTDIPHKPSMVYSEWLYNQNTLLVAGVPSYAFLEIAQNLSSSAEKNGIKLRMPWGAHITAGRFTEPRTPKELSDFFKLMKEAPVLGVSIPKYIDVGYFSFSKDGFKITTDERFELSELPQFLF